MCMSVCVGGGCFLLVFYSKMISHGGVSRDQR